MMANLEKYMDLQADFYHYMVEYGGIAKKTCSDYVTRMKFDLGYISFNPKGKIMCSRLLDKFDREAIGLTSDLHLVKLENQHLKYLKYHNENCFLL